MKIKDHPGSTTFEWHPLIVTDDLAIIEATTKYPKDTYSNLWVLRLDNLGQARQFTEWWMKHPGKNDHSGAAPSRVSRDSAQCTVCSCGRSVCASAGCRACRESGRNGGTSRRDLQAQPVAGREPVEARVEGECQALHCAVTPSAARRSGAPSS
ncbi:MAG TPA: hypothetical protein VFG35_29745 [Actinoplanes sp.]|nr:hypothetical protein [Actinoplanes sp.]